jgi:hypothetical protein
MISTHVTIDVDRLGLDHIIIHCSECAQYVPSIVHNPNPTDFVVSMVHVCYIYRSFGLNYIVDILMCDSYCFRIICMHRHVSVPTYTHWLFDHMLQQEPVSEKSLRLFEKPCFFVCRQPTGLRNFAASHGRGQYHAKSGN